MKNSLSKRDSMEINHYVMLTIFIISAGLMLTKLYLAKEQIKNEENIKRESINNFIK